MIATTLDTPLGVLTLAGDDAGLRTIRFPDEPPLPVGRGSLPLLDDARRQLAEWFDGTRKEFDLVLAPEGTEFQRRVWDALRAIPYGTTTTYRDIASRVGSSARAVGNANGRNPLPIVVPCHRVIGSDGSLTGYAGGLSVKRALLAHEGAALLPF